MSRSKNTAGNGVKQALFGSFMGVAIFFGLILLFIAFYTVQAGERKIVKRFGEAVGVSGEGVHFKVPFIDSTESVDIRTHAVGSPTSAASSDLQIVTTTVSLNYHYDKDKLIDIMRRTGFAVDKKIIIPRIEETVKAVTARYSAENLLKLRGEVKQQIDNKLRKMLAEYDLVVEDVQITDFKFSKAFSDAIETKQTEEQRALTAKNILERKKYEAQSLVTMAKGEAEAIRIQSQAIQEQGGKDYVNLKAIEKWDGKLPTYAGGGALPFININSQNQGK